MRLILTGGGNNHSRGYVYRITLRQGKDMSENTALQPGTPAPNFTLHSTPDMSVTLTELLGKPVVLVFYPADWSPVCGDQLALYNELLGEITHYGATIIGISVDGIWCHTAFSHDRKIGFPLVSDFEPKGTVAKLYGVYRETDGISERALFVIDGDGIIKYSFISPIGINPGADGILNALDQLATGNN